MENDRKLRDILQRLIDGRQKPEDKEKIAYWLDHLDLGEKMDEQSLDKLKSRSIGELRDMIAPSPQSSGKYNAYYRWAAAAAVVLLLAVTALWVTPAKFREAQEGDSAIAYNEHRTTAGQRKLITLADGTRVWLGNVSKIRYLKEFAGKREVYLDGQAFFEVQPDADKPFLVYAGDLSVKVLGTSFDVKYYTKDREPAVSVESGKVSVVPTNSKEQWILQQGQQVIYNPKEHTGAVQKADLSLVLGWKRGELIFREKTLAEISVLLARWYDVDIQVQSSELRSCQLSMSVKDESLQRVLGMLAVVGNFHFKIEGRKVTIW